MTRRLLPLFALGALCAALAIAPAATAEPAGARPNIVFMLSDDMGWNQPGFNGGKKELTPNIDALKAGGLNLTQFYTHSVCARHAPLSSPAATPSAPGPTGARRTSASPAT